MTGIDDNFDPTVHVGKNKIMIQALDTSGSMSGAPIEALKLGAKFIGEKYYENEPNQRPFEEFITMDYNSSVTTFSESNLVDYTRKIDNLRAGGGTNFMNVFYEIQNLLERKPNLEELVVIFVTDGQDGFRPNFGTSDTHYDDQSNKIRAREELKSKFLCVGFSRGHDAKFLNRIANMGSAQGNFAFIDSYEEGWRDNLNTSLLE